jgi:hypothetical protein
VALVELLAAGEAVDVDHALHVGADLHRHRQERHQLAAVGAAERAGEEPGRAVAVGHHGLAAIEALGQEVERRRRRPLDRDWRRRAS